MGNDKRNKKSVGKGRLLKKIIPVVICFAIIGTGVNFYLRHLEEQKRQMELAEKQRQEELERERQRKLLEEKRREFNLLVAEMKRYYEAGNFEKARASAHKALELARQYNFNTDEIYRILRLMEIAEYTGKLRKLEALNRDIYKYFYVRKEVVNIPSISGLRDLRNSILRQTYKNEYLVALILAERSAVRGMEAENPLYYYLISRDYLDSAITLRKKHRIPVSSDEDRVRYHQRELFFYSEKVRRETVPSSL